MNQPLKIGITDCGKFENYRRWIEMEPGVETVKLSFHNRNVQDVASCDGIVFSGGEDVHPGLYGNPEYVNQFGLKEIIPERDEFEYEVIEKAFAMKKPVLGICRGLQLINVYLGGSLVPDIPALLHSSAHGKISGQDQTHFIRVDAGSELLDISGQKTGHVNSAHHQSVERPADVLKISAYSDPDVVEAMEWKNSENRSWLLMVQWHPERMSDLSSPFSLKVKSAFLEAAFKKENHGSFKNR
ncbi:MAG: gamma-glutamyl-gamma-aminobutyrate hydrolase family protein [Bacteroidota bacterium]|nr:gamma-glutamyl-gamma-aminobutyrate hydrolase family protein [Bacteroidota bacterium]